MRLCIRLLGAYINSSLENMMSQETSVSQNGSIDRLQRAGWESASHPFYLQRQAPAGNWVDSIGTSDAESALKLVGFYERGGDKVRVVEYQFRVVSK